MLDIYDLYEENTHFSKSIDSFQYFLTNENRLEFEKNSDFLNETD